MRLMMWSGPRNLSTAMMYSFAARGDCAVWDEPFYAAYLARTGLAHPMAAEIIASHEADPAMVARHCAGEAADGSAVFYQKHMTQHMLPEFDLGWMAGAVHVFLIRHPARVIASYHRKRQDPSFADIGGIEQLRLYDEARARTGSDPVVIDSADIRAAPEKMLRALCGSVGLDFTPSMLSWAKGGHPSDGVWASHWYNAVHESTGFESAEGPLPEIPPHLLPVLDAALPAYEALRARVLTSCSNLR